MRLSDMQIYTITIRYTRQVNHCDALGDRVGTSKLPGALKDIVVMAPRYGEGESLARVAALGSFGPTSEGEELPTIVEIKRGPAPNIIVDVER